LLSDPLLWSVDEVVKWALTIGVSSKNAERLRDQEIDGAHLRDLTEEKMVKLCGMSLAAASDIMKGLAKLFPAMPSAASAAPGPPCFFLGMCLN
jgi:hypothetical protein